MFEAAGGSHVFETEEKDGREFLIDDPEIVRLHL